MNRRPLIVRLTNRPAATLTLKIMLRLVLHVLVPVQAIGMKVTGGLSSVMEKGAGGHNRHIKAKVRDGAAESGTIGAARAAAADVEVNVGKYVAPR